MGYRNAADILPENLLEAIQAYIEGKQWIGLNKELELLDPPGILWPKFEDQQVGMHLAFIGSMNDEIIVMEELALRYGLARGTIRNIIYKQNV